MFELGSKEDFLKRQSREQLIIFLKNQEYIEYDLRDRLLSLTGCGDFGHCDGMNGSCVECSYNNIQLFEKCSAFKESQNKKLTKELEKIKNSIVE